MTTRTTYAERMRADGKFPAVLRFATMTPHDAIAMIKHGEREIGNLDHVDPSRSHLNRTLIGSSKTGYELVEESRQLAEFNLRSNILGLQKNRTKKEVRAAREKGLRDPWNTQKKSRGPLREVVVTVHRDFFRAGGDCPPEHVMPFVDDEGEEARFDTRKLDRFVEAGYGFLAEEFEYSLRYLRADLDEQSVHLQGILADVVDEPASTRYALGRKLFRMSQYRCIKSYEVGQDAVGHFFFREEHRDMNIVRGEGRAAKMRGAKKRVEELKREASDLDEFFGQPVALPEASRDAQAALLLKRKMADAIEDKGSAEKVRKGATQDLALDYLQALGVLTADERTGVSTRRAKDQLLAKHETAFGTATEIIADPDVAAAKAMEQARKKIEAEKFAQKEADERAAADRARLERDAEQRRRREDEERAERIRVEDETRAKREAEVVEREAEVDRKMSWLNEKLHELFPIADGLRQASEWIEKSNNTVLRKALGYAEKLSTTFTRPGREK